MLEEKWKPVKGYETEYEVSNLGNIRGKERKNTVGRKIAQRILKLRNDKDGYKDVALYKDKKMKRHKVHRLVAIAFIPNPENKKEVNHINGDKSDNKVCNLEWVTSKENTTHAIKEGLFKPPISEVKVNQYSMDGTFIKAFKSVNEASRETKISVSLISMCINHKRVSGGGFRWERGEADCT